MISPLSSASETVEVEYLLSIDWGMSADGLPIGYDDGPQYDAIESTLTARLTPAQVEAVRESMQVDGGAITIDGSGYLLGPTINHVAGVDCRLVSFVQDGPADSSLSLIDCTAAIHYGPLSAPSGGSLEYVLAHGVPYPSDDPLHLPWLDEAGGSHADARGQYSTASVRWYSGQLTTTQAADAVNALRSLRTARTSWTSMIRPFGEGSSFTNYITIPRFKVVRESALTWAIELEIYRHV